jgi:hypothetical protein
MSAKNRVPRDGTLGELIRYFEELEGGPCPCCGSKVDPSLRTCPQCREWLYKFLPPVDRIGAYGPDVPPEAFREDPGEVEVRTGLWTSEVIPHEEFLRRQRAADPPETLKALERDPPRPLDRPFVLGIVADLMRRRGLTFEWAKRLTVAEAGATLAPPESDRRVETSHPSGDPARPRPGTPRAKRAAKGTPGVSGRRSGQALTDAEEREYRRIIRELKKLPHAMSGKNRKVADRLGIDIKVVVRAEKWGRRHELL